MTHEERLNVLLVDDQPAKLLTYETILNGLGENLIKATSAREALECLLRHEVAVVLVDVCMPDLDGYELAAMIRDHPRHQRCSIIFVSAVLLTDLDRLRGYECGAVDYVPVPVVPEILRAKVGVFAELYRKSRELERLNAELERRVAERTAELECSTIALEASARRKDEFLAVLAHELRNPLAPVRSAVQLLRMPDLKEPDRRRAEAMLERQVDQLVRLVDDLLDVSRISRGLVTIQREPLDARVIVTRALETMKPILESRRQSLVTCVPTIGLHVEGDVVRLAQVLGNIVHNAAKFSAVGDSIRVELRREGNEIVFEVSDTGAGIAPELLEHVFDLFTQGDSSLARSSGGLGIGLAVVKSIVTLHGGRVSVESAGVGQGTTVTVRLPAIEPPALVAGELVEQRIESVAGRRVLVVDDNRDAGQALAMLLERRGGTVRHAIDGEEALVMGDQFQPEVVLLDIGMPRMNGYDVARTMRTRPWGRDIPLIAVTGWGQPSDRERSAAAGFDAHLVKPVSESDLRRVIDGLSARAEPRARV